MCDCQKNQIANGLSIGDLFNRNQFAVAKVFKKYNFGQYPVDLKTTAMLANELNGSFKQEIAAAIASGTSNLTGAETAGLTAAIFGALGQVTNAGVGIYNTVQANKNPGAPQAPVFTPQPATYTPAPQAPKEEPKRYLGFTAGQLGLIAGAILMVVAVVYFTKDK